MKSVQPGSLSGAIQAPPSKSMMQRAVLAAALARGRSTILHPSYSDDGLASLRIAEALGAVIERREDAVVIEGGGKPVRHELDCGESGLCLRMTSAVASLFDEEFTVTGHGSLTGRPVDMIVGPLRALGASCESSSGRLPLRIKGPIRGGQVEVDGSKSSQFLSGLLMALPVCPVDTILTLPLLKSKAYVRMTLALLAAFGVKIEYSGNLLTYRVRGRQKFSAVEYPVEGDWSGAAFLMVAGAVSGSVEVRNLDLNSPQADRAVLEVLHLAGAKVETGRDAVRVSKAPLKGFDFDASECPDLFPPLAVLASSCGGTCRISGTERLKFKESDRTMALIEELGSLGADISESGNALVIEGGKALKGGTVSSHGDHRIAMACAIAALTAAGPVCIQNEECVAKSFPDFFETLESVRI